MSKFASVIEAARKSEGTGDAPATAPESMILGTREAGKTGSPDHGLRGSRQSMNTGSPETVKPEKSEHVNKARQEAGSTVSQETAITASREPVKTSNLTVTIPTSQRNYWVGEARKRGTTVTAVIVEALSARLGTPNE